MPPRGRKGAGKKTTPKAKNPSRRTPTKAKAEAVEEKSVTEAEVPVESVPVNTVGEPESLPPAVEEKTVVKEEVLVEKKIEDANVEGSASVKTENVHNQTEVGNAEEAVNVNTEVNVMESEDRIDVKMETVETIEVKTDIMETIEVKTDITETIEVKEVTVTQLVDGHTSEPVNEEKDNEVPTEPEAVADGKADAVLEVPKGENDGNISREPEKMKDGADDITEVPVRDEKDAESFEAPGDVAVRTEEPEHIEEDNDGDDDEDPEEIMDERASDSASMEQDEANKEIGDEETLMGDQNNERGEVGDASHGKGGDKVGDVDESGSEDEEEDEENEEEDEDPSVYMHAPLSERKKQKEFEIFVGGLDKEAVEEDLTKVFGEFGEIQAARIVKHPTTQKSKGFAFIRYATVEQAKKALLELKDGAEVKGKRVGISASQDNDTLYMGNICKTWTKDHVLETLKGYGVEQIEEIYLPEDPKNEGKSKGFALLEFGTHSDAMAAFQRLRKPDAIFGCDRSARVSFAQSSMHPSEEALSQVKTVYIENLPGSWDEEKVKEHCNKYGEIEKIQLSRNFTTARRKDFGFITFLSRESAVACVEGINNAQMGEGENKVKANLAKPQNKGRLAKQGARGGFKVRKDGECTEEAGRSMKARSRTKSKGSELKGKGASNFRSGRRGQPVRPHDRSGQGGGRIEDRQRREPQLRGAKRGGRGEPHDYNSRPSKKARGNMHGRPANDFGGRRDSRYGKPKGNYPSRPPPYRDPYASGYSAPGYPGRGYGPASGSKRHYSDMEPHAGYLGPAPKQGHHDSYGYGHRSAGGYNHASTATGYAGGSVAQASYGSEYSSYPGYEAGYGYPTSGGAYPSNASAYPPSNAAYPPSNAAYPSSSAGYPPSGGAYPPSAGAYPPPPRRPYY